LEPGKSSEAAKELIDTGSVERRPGSIKIMNCGYCGECDLVGDSVKKMHHRHDQYLTISRNIGIHQSSVDCIHDLFTVTHPPKRKQCPYLVNNAIKS